MVRGTVLSLKENLFIESARALGTRPHQILLWHVFPHLLRDLNVRITLDIGYAVLALTGLSFLGLGLQNPTPEWGLLVASARPYVLSAWWYAAFPGAVIFAAVLVFTVLGDAFFDALELGGVRR
jgi:peptide/nickel transport system permease protein